MDDLAALHERTERANLAADLLADRCNQADPSVRSGWNRVSGWYTAGDWHKRASNALEVVDPSRYADDELGTAAFRADFAEARRDWLREQSVRLETAAERRHAGYEAASRGIARFLDEGRFGLDRITGTVSGDPESLAEIRAEAIARRQRERTDAIEERA